MRTRSVPRVSSLLLWLCVTHSGLASDFYNNRWDTPEPGVCVSYAPIPYRNQIECGEDFFRNHLLYPKACIAMANEQYNEEVMRRLSMILGQDRRYRYMPLLMCDPLTPQGNGAPPAVWMAYHGGKPVFAPRGNITLCPNDDGTMSIFVRDPTSNKVMSQRNSFCFVNRLENGDVKIRDCRNPRNFLRNVTFDPNVKGGYTWGQGCRQSIIGNFRGQAGRALGAMGGIFAGNFAEGCMQGMSNKANCNVSGMTLADNLEIGARMCLNPDVGSTMGYGDPGPNAPTVSRDQVMERVRDMGLFSSRSPIYGSSFCSPRRLQNDPTIGEVWDKVCNKASDYFGGICDDFCDTFNNVKSRCGY